MARLPFPLGRKVEHDARSIAFPAPVGATVQSQSWPRQGPVLDQGQLSSCTGNAIAQACNTDPVRKSDGRLLTESDAVALYSRATQVDEFSGTYPPDDTGSSGLAAAKAAQEKGLISGYTHGFGLDHSLGALQFGPIIVGLPWYNDMFNPNSAGFVSPTGGVVGGHEVLVYGVDVPNRTVLAWNSWGSRWGLSGAFRMTYDVFSRLLSENGDATVPTPPTQPPPTPNTDAALVTALRRVLPSSWLPLYARSPAQAWLAQSTPATVSALAAALRRVLLRWVPSDLRTSANAWLVGK